MEQDHAQDSQRSNDSSLFQIEEETFLRSEEHFRLFVEALPQIIWTAQANGTVDYYNQAWYDFTGDTREKPLECGWRVKSVHPEDQQKTLNAWHQALQTGTRCSIEQRLWDKRENRYHWFLAQALPVYNRQRKVIKWLGTYTDIDKSKRAEEELLFHASLAHSVLDAVVVTSLASEILNWNKAAETLYGWTEEEVKGKRLDQLLQIQYPGGSRDAWLKELLENNYWQGEIHQQKKDGAWIDIRTGVSVLRNMDGKAVGMVGIIRDITKSKQVARDLQEREQQLQAAIELAKLGIWKLYLKSSKIECSTRSKAHFGYAADTDLTLEMIIERIMPEDRDLNLKMALEQREEYHGEYRVVWPDGTLHWIALGGMGQYSKSGKPFAVVGVTLDITERKLEEQRKDTFIGMASHELKTPLTTIKGFAQLLKRQLKRLALEEQITLLNRMDGQINAMTTLVNELMDVSKIQSGQLEYHWEEIDMDLLVQKIVEIVQQTDPQHFIQITGKAGKKTIGDQAHLEQVVTNLLTNALKYSPQARQVDVLLSSEQDSILLKVRDYGIGIPSEERTRIFSRFYRANTAWSRAISGLGMGLYIAQEIVEKHGGKLYVESTVGEGSTFCLELPCAGTQKNAEPRSN